MSKALKHSIVATLLVMHGLTQSTPATAQREPALRVRTEHGAMHLDILLDAQRLSELSLRWPLAEGHDLPFEAWLIALPEGNTSPQVVIHELRVEHIAELVLPPRLGNDVPRALPPSWPLHVERVGVMRGIALARVQFFPARPVGEGWEVVRVLRATVRWRVPSEMPLMPNNHETTEDPLLGVVRAHVMNPQEVEGQRRHDARSFNVSGQPLALIDVAQPALIAITRAMLEAAGVQVGSPHTLRLRQGNAEVLMMWEGDADEHFEEGERLLFYAAPRFSRYADHDTWVLEDAGVPVARMETRDSAPSGALPLGALRATLLFERNAIYTPDCGCRPPVHRDGDRWAWASVQQGQVWTHAFTLPLSNTQHVTITLWLLGYTDPPQSPDHRVQVWLNGAPLGEVTWDGRQAITATFTGVVGSSNALSVTLPGILGVPLEGMWVDAFAVTLPTEGQEVIAQPLVGETAVRSYHLSFVPSYLLDVTVPTQPTRLVNWQHEGTGIRFADPASSSLPRRYVAFAQGVSPLRVRAPEVLNPAAGDFHILAPRAFLPALAPLIARRTAQGFSVVTQSVQAIYDHYGDGRVDPQAIHAYFAARYHNDAPRPAYALLVGDGTLDPKRYRLNTPPTQVPPFLADVDPFLGETAADNRFVTVDGGDALPDIALGRLPVNTLTETQRVVSKILAYEDALLTPSERSVLIVADDADAGGNFPNMARALATQVPATFRAVTATMASSAALTEVRQVLLAHWRYARLLTYFGHASPRQWAVERLLHRDDVLDLPLHAALPVVTAMTCYTSRFHELQDTLDETLVRAEGRGAVATWGATGLTLSVGHLPLARGFAQAWLAGARLGEAALAGKLALAQGGVALDLLDTYTLLGDPTLVLGSRWASHAVYLPLTRR